MKPSLWIVLGVVVVVGAAVSAPFVFGRGHEGAQPVKQEKEDERNVSIDAVPEAVKATILKEAGDNKITEIEEETKHGTTIYEAEWRVDGKEVEIKVAADGTLLKKEIEDEDEHEGDDDDDDDGPDDDD